jgi:hypothetical protein
MNKGKLSFKSRLWNKKIKSKNMVCEDVNAKGLYYKNMIRTKQDHNKDTYSKLVSNRLNVMCDSTFIYTHWAPNSKKLFKKNSIYMWLMFTHV